MISFKDIKLTKQKNTIYIPQHLKWTLENFLKRDFPHIETWTIMSWRMKDGSVTTLARDKFLFQHKDMFDGTEYENLPAEYYVGFESYISTDYLLEKLKSFYGLGKDEEVREWEKERSKNMLMGHAADIMDDIVLPLDAREFEVIGSYEEMENLQELMRKKNLGKDEIALVLKCIKKNK